MEFKLKREDDNLTVLVSGKVDTVTAPEFEKTVLDNLDGVKKLVLDLNEMSYISSAGLRVLLILQKKIVHQGEMELINVCDDVKDIFEITGFSDILKIN